MVTPGPPEGIRDFDLSEEDGAEGIIPLGSDFDCGNRKKQE
jgi:hypothetical protein